MNKSLLIGIVAALLPISASAQSGLRFEASVSKQEVYFDNSFELVFTLFDAEGSGFRPPDLSNFRIEAGPSQRFDAALINGKASQSMSYLYVLLPLRTGTFTIGSAAVKAGGRTLQTAPVRIEVLAARSDLSREAFAEARLSIPKAYVGQQVLLDYVFYLSAPSWSTNITAEDDYSGFHAIVWDNTINGKERIDGVEFHTLTERISLFPQRSGVFTIQPLELDVLEWKRDGFSPFGHSSKRMSIATAPVSVEVLPLPAGAPASFTGAVGRFLMEAEMERSSGTTDETFALRMSIAGSGDMKRVEAPPLALPEGLFGYDPKVVEESAPRSFQMLTGQKTLEYLITAAEPGRYVIRPEFSYFDTDSARYITQPAGPFTIEVTQGRGVRAPDTWERQEGAGASLASRLLWPLLSAGAILAALAFFLVQRRRNKKMQGLEGADIRMDARRRLSNASRHLYLGEMQPFYREIARALYEFCSERLDIPPAECTKERIGQALDSRGVEKAVSDQLLEILHTAEMALFARADQSELAPGVYRTTVEIISRLEESLEKS